MESTYYDICRAKSVTPAKEVINMLQNKEDTLKLDFASNENEFFCIASILQENLDYLTTLIVKNTDFSKISLNSFTKLFKVSTYIKKLTINSSIFPSSESFSYFCQSLSTNTSLTLIDFSNNNLNDSFGSPLLDLISKTSSLKEIIFDNNSFHETNFGQSFSTSPIEIISLNSNPLSVTVLNSIITATKINKNIKSLSIKGIDIGKNQYYIELGLAEALENNNLVFLGFDFNDTHPKFVKDLENALSFYNKSLICLNSSFVNWDNVQDGDVLYGVKKALFANLYFSTVSNRNAVVEHGIFHEIQGILLKKIRGGSEVGEAGKDGREVGQSRSASKAFLSMSGSLTYSDISMLELKEKTFFPVDDKGKIEVLIDICETLDAKLNGFITSTSSRLVKIDTSFENCTESLAKTLKTEDFHVISSKTETLSQNIMSYAQEFETFKETLNTKIESIEKSIKELPKNENPHSKPVAINENSIKNTEKIIQIQKTLQLLGEELENLKSLDVKIEKNHYSLKSQIKNLHVGFCSKQDIANYVLQVQNLTEKATEVSEDIEEIRKNMQKYWEEKDTLGKGLQNLHKQIGENEKSVKDNNGKIMLLEEKVANSMKIKEILKNRDEEIYKHISDLDMQIMECQELVKFADIKTDIEKLLIRIGQIEDTSTGKITKIENSMQGVQNILDYWDQKFNKLEEEFHLIIENQKKTQELSAELSISDHEIEKPPEIEKFNFSKTLTDRLEKLEKLNVHKKALDIQKDFDEGIEFVPGETETLVRSAVMERVSKFNQSAISRGGLKSIGPLTPSYNFSSFEEDIQPSFELREDLKVKGLNYFKFRN
ncbi:hypothetical protein SteCoe_30351 [Stentor coeruleus]|uniref:Uncharacterized protein n=1 Tax=Stentor coeruleus TaxID=5963 RepID=A0A1R2B3R1_9CILI|nr:hypothetical protein SteCoe_30351 [Stentor coeruleus]